MFTFTFHNTRITRYIIISYLTAMEPGSLYAVTSAEVADTFKNRWYSNNKQIATFCSDQTTDFVYTAYVLPDTRRANVLYNTRIRQTRPIFSYTVVVHRLVINHYNLCCIELRCEDSAALRLHFVSTNKTYVNSALYYTIIRYVDFTLNGTYLISNIKSNRTRFVIKTVGRCLNSIKSRGVFFFIAISYTCVRQRFPKCSPRRPG